MQINLYRLFQQTIYYSTLYPTSRHPTHLWPCSSSAEPFCPPISHIIIDWSKLPEYNHFFSESHVILWTLPTKEIKDWKSKTTTLYSIIMLTRRTTQALTHRKLTGTNKCGYYELQRSTNRQRALNPLKVIYVIFTDLNALLMLLSLSMIVLHTTWKRGFHLIDLPWKHNKSGNQTCKFSPVKDNKRRHTKCYY